MAINEVAYLNLKKGVSLKRIHIYSDSKAALQALDNVEINSKIVYETAQHLNKLCVNNMVKLSWVPGHSNIKGNDIADSLARLGSSTQFADPEPYIGVPWSTIEFRSARRSVQTWFRFAPCGFLNLFLFGRKKVRKKESKNQKYLCREHTNNTTYSAQI